MSGCRPRDREVDRLNGARDDVPDGEPAVVFQHSTRFAVEASLVGDVHLCVLAPDDVERAVGEREFECVGVHDGDAFGESGCAVEPFGGFAVVGA